MAHCFTLKGNKCIQRNILISLFDILKFRPIQTLSFSSSSRSWIWFRVEFYFHPIILFHLIAGQSPTLESENQRTEQFLGVIYKDLQKLDCSKNPISVTWGILLLWPTLIDGLHIGKEVANKKKANSIWLCQTVTAKTKLEKGSVNSEVKRKIVIEFRSWDSSNEIQFSIRPSENFPFFNNALLSF